MLWGNSMRLWSIHPAYLDSKGLLALWREALLAQKVLMGNTLGYTNHPQLIRFKNTDDPSACLAAYLRFIALEADNRDYKFNKEKIINKTFDGKIPVKEGQLVYEFEHLLDKLKHREAKLYHKLKRVKRIRLHPIFFTVTGGIEDWEVVS